MMYLSSLATPSPTADILDHDLVHPAFLDALLLGPAGGLPHVDRAVRTARLALKDQDAPLLVDTGIRLPAFGAKDKSLSVVHYAVGHLGRGELSLQDQPLSLYLSGVPSSSGGTEQVVWLAQGIDDLSEVTDHVIFPSRKMSGSGTLNLSCFSMVSEGSPWPARAVIDNRHQAWDPNSQDAPLI